MEINYCGFIEVWKGNLTGKTYNSNIEDIKWLGVIPNFLTVAIFKIKLKQKTNE